MTPKFELVLRNDKLKSYYRITIFVLLLQTLVITWFLVSGNQTALQKISGIAALLPLLVFTGNYLVKHPSVRIDSLFPVSAVLITIYWLFSGYWLAGLLTVILFLLYLVSRRKLTVSFYTDRIDYPSFPKRKIKWGELSNVVLKDGWLTIDFKNNRIIQQFTEETTDTGNEKEFNDFCRQLLN